MFPLSALLLPVMNTVSLSRLLLLIRFLVFLSLCGDFKGLAKNKARIETRANV